MEDTLLGKKTSQRDRAIEGHDREFGEMTWKRPDHLMDLSYIELEDRNLEMKKKRAGGMSSEEIREEMLNYLEKEKGIKAVTVCFTDLEGKLHTLDYDKKFLIGSEDNLTFDGSSIRGFSVQRESDLRLKIDWTSFRWVPADLFGTGKVLVFSNVCDKDGSFYSTDFRSNLMELCERLKKEQGVTVNVAPEVEGFLFKGINAEYEFDELKGFELATMSGYYSSLPQDTLRIFMDKFAEVQRALAFENEKDHPEVAPAQFELNFKYTLALDTADQIQLYKLLARQVARSMGLTACFLPKPIQGLNGSGMHTNVSLSKDGVNMFYDKNGEHNLSDMARRFITSILYYAKDLCLLMNSSVNAYRRLDPHFEAPNEIKVSPTDRGSMVRIPIGNEKSSRVEVRTVAPDANPYLYLYAIIRAGLKGIGANGEELMEMEKMVYRDHIEKLPSDIYVALDHFKASEYAKEILGEENHAKFADLKERAANRSPKALGTKVKRGEVIYHHEVSNQYIWADF